jgi:transcriptional regulator with XRE-family HTH domain
MALRADFDWAEAGQRIRSRRLALQRTQQQLAKQARLTQNAIFRLETGETNPQIDTLRAVARALGTSARELICGINVDDPRLGNRLVLIRRIVESGDGDAIRAMDSGLENARTLLNRARGFGHGQKRRVEGKVTGKLRVALPPDDDLRFLISSPAVRPANPTSQRVVRDSRKNKSKSIKIYLPDDVPHLPMGNAKKIALPESNGKKGQYERARRGAASAAPIATQR